MCDKISLSMGRMRLDISPEGGGSIERFARLSKVGEWVNLMRPALDGTREMRDPVKMSCFPLVPYCDLVTGACFEFDGVRYQLPRNYPRASDPIHGEGWLTAWQVDYATETKALIRFAHRAGEAGFPFSYSASQLFELGENYLAITISLTNEDVRPMPCGVGIHPYYVRTPDLVVSAGVKQVWPADAARNRTGAIPVPPEWDFRRPRQFGDVDLDHSFADWNCRYDLVWASLSTGLTVTADPIFRNLLIFVPRNGDHVCIEPISNAMDAFNLACLGIEGHNVSVLQPGHDLTGRVVFRPWDLT